jgi:hypothetical protein
MRRRSLLSAGPAVGGLAGLAGLAGCLGLAYPEVEGTVRRKTFAGQSGGEWRTLVEATPDGFEVAPPVRGEGESPGVIGQYLTERLVEGEYDAVRFTLALSLSTRDPVNDVPPGGTYVYEIDRLGFNAARPGEPVVARVARFGPGRLSHVAGGAADVDGVEGG